MTGTTVGREFALEELFAKKLRVSIIGTVQYFTGTCRRPVASTAPH